MEYIELVIKIPEYEYKNILITGKARFCAVNAIEAGVPLPKGHGRLFDERDIVNGNYKIIGNKIYEVEPIIEADTESEG